ncbi:MAG: D-alanyl-D-alanine carboxypeptidase [Gammaproteobacteria bacterium]|nr:D-alanyl-D-alanine carboxypeptidase [Gammaproteobacteria bacterium]
MLRPFLSCVLLLGLAAAPCLADIPIPNPPDIDATAYVLVDFHTGKILAAKNAVEKVPMASLTKLMTAYIVFEELADGKLKLDEPVTISEHAWRQGGSRTFVQVGTKVPVRSLILGMVVQSGNDATVALAERIAGTEGTFVQMMNETARKLGMLDTHYVDSTGLPDPQHYTTARDLSLLATALIRDFPQYYHWFSVKEFEYNGIKQQNRNGLLNTDPGVDGLKTGHTEAAGYCLVASALRNGMRLVSVVLGGQTFTGRETSSAALLNYGFTFFDTKLVARARAPLASVPVWKAAAPTVGVGISNDLYVTVPRDDSARLKTSVRLQPRLIAPLTTAAVVGSLDVTDGARTVASVPLHPLQADPAGGWWRSMVDTTRLWFN